jgi:hypothetical protein
MMMMKNVAHARLSRKTGHGDLLGCIIHLKRRTRPIEASLYILVDGKSHGLEANM